MKKIVVTGGMGFIGAHTVVSLLEQQYEVIILDNLVNARLETLTGIEAITAKRPAYYNIDMCDASKLDAFFKEQGDVEAVIHFAALKAVGESVEKPLLYYHNNMVGLINLLMSMQKYEVSKLVFSSSATVYGEPDSLPITEENTTKPAMSPYGNTKKIAEDIIRDLTNADKKFNAISLRYFNPIGAHASANIGELPNGIPNNLMPYITQTAIGLRKELMVFGGDYNTPDGTAVRDYIHVVDLADAHVKTLERMFVGKQKNNYEVFNLGTGKGSTVLEVIKSFERTTGEKIPYKIVGRRDGDAESTYAATDLANKELNWNAQYNLDDMTKSAWNWERAVRKIK